MPGHDRRCPAACERARGRAGRRRRSPVSRRDRAGPPARRRAQRVAVAARAPKTWAGMPRSKATTSPTIERDDAVHVAGIYRTSGIPATRAAARAAGTLRGMHDRRSSSSTASTSSTRSARSRSCADAFDDGVRDARGRARGALRPRRRGRARRAPSARAPTWSSSPAAAGSTARRRARGPRRERGAVPAALADRHAAGTLLASVCTGALLLAAAGILDGRRATTNPQALDEPARVRAASTSSRRAWSTTATSSPPARRRAGSTSRCTCSSAIGGPAVSRGRRTRARTRSDRAVEPRVRARVRPRSSVGSGGQASSRSASARRNRAAARRRARGGPSSCTGRSCGGSRSSRCRARP